MTLSDLKRKIFKEELVVQLLESIGCLNIKFEQGGNLITAQLPDRFNSKNKRAVQCRNNESLSCVIRNRSDFSGDIFNLVSYLQFDVDSNDLQSDINNAKNYICELFNWTNVGYNIGIKKKDVLHELKKRSSKNKNKNVLNKTIDENILYDNFIQLPNKVWEDEGISLATQKKYGIGFDLMSKRITVPIRNKYGQLVGVKGRLIKDEDVNEYEPKYLYLYKCNQSRELFNFYIAKEHAIKNKEIIIVEGEKSCMKFYENGIYNVVALGSSDISEVQKNMINSLGLDIEIIFAYDNDKELSEIYKNGKKFKNRKVSYIYDTDDLLKPKSAPIDSGIEVWKELYLYNKFEMGDDED